MSDPRHPWVELMYSMPVPGILFVCDVDAATYRRRPASPQGRVNAVIRWYTGASPLLGGHGSAGACLRTLTRQNIHKSACLRQDALTLSGDILAAVRK